MKKLKGITWAHSRGFTSIVAVSQRYAELHPDIDITWEKRSLQEFADAPVEKLAEAYDLLIIDHPWAGFAAKHKILLPLQEYLSEEYLNDQAENSVGASHNSYALGGNERAARLSGIKTDLYGIIAFAISGFCCALVGIMMTTKLGSVSATYASGYEMDAIAATVIGGTSINGGEGSVGRTVAGILLLGVLSNAFDLMGIGIEYQYVFKGVVILLAVSADKISDFTKSKKVSFQK